MVLPVYGSENKYPVMLTEMDKNRKSFFFNTLYCTFLETHMVCVGAIRKEPVCGGVEAQQPSAILHSQGWTFHPLHSGSESSAAA